MRILLVFIFLLTCTFVSPNDLHQRKRRLGNFNTALDDPNQQKERENGEAIKSRNTHKLVVNNATQIQGQSSQHDTKSEANPDTASKVNQPPNPQPHVDKEVKNADPPVPKTDKTISNAQNKIPGKTEVSKVQTEVKNISPNGNPAGNFQEESGFLKTTMIILVTFSIAFIIFVAYKTYRRSYRSARIRKYGVRLARGNIEMTPLPLDNDDEDETVFDLKNVPI